MITLNGVTLSDDLFWDNEFSESLISQQFRRTILGKSILITMPKSSGRTIILKASISGQKVQGYFTNAQIKQFRSLEQSGQSVVFIYEDQTITVVVKAGGVNIAPHLERPNPSSTDMYSGTLTLIER